MEKHEVGRKSTRTVPVIIYNHDNSTKKTKLMVPFNYTAGHLVNVLRSRLHLLPSHPVYLFLKSKHSPVRMSNSIGHLHHKHRDEKGLLRLIHAGQTSFGFRGNIRAIRFRQKWIENHHNTMHQDNTYHAPGGPPSDFGVPPPFFPLEPPSTTNFGPSLGLEDILLGSVEQLNSLDDEVEEELDSMSMYEMSMYEYNASEAFPIGQWQPSNTTDSSQLSAVTNSSQSSTITSYAYSFSISDDVDPWLSSSLADPWLSVSAQNSGQASGGATSLFPSAAEEEAFNNLTHLMAQNIYNEVINGSSSSTNPDLSADVQPSNIPSSEPVIFQNNEEPPQSQSLYESDSDFYDSDKDVGIDE